jgi:predicted RNA-binding Zn ribbon-like protein
MHTHTFDLDAGALCLDFANSVDWHASDHPDDKLHNFTDLIAWAEAAAVLSPDRADRSRQMAQKQPQMARAAFERAIGLRELIYRLFVDVSEQETVHAEDLALLNEALNESLSHLQIVTSSTGFNWGWAESSVEFDQILWPVARSAGELLTSDRLGRVRQCADDRGCGYLFVDTSRNRSRRWCSMESCGNRAKARRHYRRQQNAQ